MRRGGLKAEKESVRLLELLTGNEEQWPDLGAVDDARAARGAVEGACWGRWDGWAARWLAPDPCPCSFWRLWVQPDWRICPYCGHELAG